MKNLIEELHKLDDMIYPVSEDFSKKVMKQIKKSKKESKFNYVISLASVGIVACLAVFFVHHTNLKNQSRYLNQKEFYQENSIQQHNQDDDLAWDTYLNNQRKDAMMNDKISGAIEETQGFPTAINMTSKDKVNAEFKEESRMSLQTEIKNILEKANFQVQAIGESLKVKASKEEIVKLLKDYETISIEVQGEYVIIQ